MSDRSSPPVLMEATRSLLPMDRVNLRDLHTGEKSVGQVQGWPIPPTSLRAFIHRFKMREDSRPDFGVIDLTIEVHRTDSSVPYQSADFVVLGLYE